MYFSNFYDQIYNYFYSQSNQRSTQIGEAEFVPNYCDQVNNQLVVTILFEKFWTINNGLYEKLKFKKVFKDMISLRALEIHMTNNNRQSLLRDLGHVEFTRLKILNLRDNALQNIQPLAYMDFVCIEEIYLDFNKINCLKSLAKIKNVTLKCLRLNENPVNNLKPLNRTFLGKNDFSLILESFSHSVLDQDLSFLAKLNSRQFKVLRCVSDERIFNKRKTDSLLKKYPDTDIQPIHE